MPLPISGATAGSGAAEAPVGYKRPWQAGRQGDGGGSWGRLAGAERAGETDSVAIGNKTCFVRSRIKVDITGIAKNRPFIPGVQPRRPGISRSDRVSVPGAQPCDDDGSARKTLSVMPFLRI